MTEMVTKRKLEQASLLSFVKDGDEIPILAEN